MEFKLDKKKGSEMRNLRDCEKKVRSVDWGGSQWSHNTRENELEGV